jgi:hypothetical protein
MSEVRAAFIGQQWSSSLEEVRAEFRTRDERLIRSVDDDEVVLWFEADLYDQLQILQVLDWFWFQPSPPTVSLICLGSFPGIQPFHGLGQLSPEALAGVFPARRVVSPAQLAAAHQAWQAVTAPTPESLKLLAGVDLTVTEYLGAALQRLLEHYPSTVNGLDRTEQQLLETMREGRTTFREIFPVFQQREERVFLGDLTLWWRILALSSGTKPPLRLTGLSDLHGPAHLISDLARCELTDFGHACLTGHADYWRENTVDRWVGGAHLTGDSLWRWDPVSGHVREFPTE